MCGIVGVISSGTLPGDIESIVTRMRDRLTHRGPDGAGLWIGDQVAFGHRRLAVIDPGPDGAQPMAAAGPDGVTGVLCYNGELYNDEEIRRSLRAAGVTFRTNCDTETVLQALNVWGANAVPRLRGMFAFAYCQPATRRVILARDALGVKPLYIARRRGALLFASEIPGLLEHPDVAAEPDPIMVSAYLTTIRTSLGGRTMFRDVESLEPGTLIETTLEAPASATPVTWWRATDEPATGASTREIVEESVVLHLRSDVPTCALLSGGLDSTITAGVAAARTPRLRTWCAGADVGEAPDFEFAQIAAERLGVRHHETRIGRDQFLQAIPEMIQSQCVPLSTPNEVAINAVARALRADGCIVTISGEGADELFAGYDRPLDAAYQYVNSNDAGDAQFSLASGSWINADIKSQILLPSFIQSADTDQWLIQMYEDLFAQCRAASPGRFEAHVRMLRRVNLTGLLQRLDTATMQASVEGRTPFADRIVAAHGESLPMDACFTPSQHATGGGPRTKMALRRAFTDLAPPEILNRPKASFPLPFQDWIGGESERLLNSPMLDRIFVRGVLEELAAAPDQHWNIAWPALNLAIWGDLVLGL